MARRRRYRRNPSGKDILLIAGVGLAGFLLYEHLKPKPVVAPAPGSTLVPIAQAGGTLISGAIDAISKLFGGSSTPAATTTPTVFLPQGMPSTPPASNPITDAVNSLFGLHKPAPDPVPPPPPPTAISGLGSLA
jgi:hypothetical protein